MSGNEAPFAGGQITGGQTHQHEIGTPPISEPGMNFISADYDLIMVNRTNERIYGKPVASLIGKKCYREFERREEPCPHCPGRLALATGETHETEAVALLDDGTRLYAHIRAHPVLGPDNTPTGFIEVVEDFTEERRAEHVASIEAELQTMLLSAKNSHRALREALEAALRIECLDWGCVFMTNRATGEQELIHQRGSMPLPMETIHTLVRGEGPPPDEDLSTASPVLEIVPITHRGTVVGTLVAGGTTCRCFPSTLKAGLRSLGVLAGNAISRIVAEQSRGDAVADLEAFIGIAPVPTWVLSAEGRLTMWNKAAEKVFGWHASELVGTAVPFGRAHEGPQPVQIAQKNGQPVNVRLVSAPFRDVVGNASTTLVMAEVLSGSGTTQDQASASSSAPADTRFDEHAETAGSVRILLVDGGEPWGQELTSLLASLGYAVTRCTSSLEAATLLNDAEALKQPFELAVVGMIYADGLSGLDQKSALRGLGLKAPVIVSSDAGVHGHEHYGIASVITRPYALERVAKAVEEALHQHPY
jgi:PAS domain-containing protein